MANFKTINSEADEPMAEINVTPLVDVMLVLLVIFIIAVPLLAESIKVDLPQVKANQNEEEKTVTITIFKGDRVEAEGKAMNWQEIQSYFSQLTTSERNKVFHISADTDVSYGRVAEILSMAQEVEIQRIALDTQPVRK